MTEKVSPSKDPGEKYIINESLRDYEEKDLRIYDFVEKELLELEKINPDLMHEIEALANKRHERVQKLVLSGPELIKFHNARKRELPADFPADCLAKTTDRGRINYPDAIQEGGEQFYPEEANDGYFEGINGDIYGIYYVAVNIDKLSDFIYKSSTDEIRWYRKNPENNMFDIIGTQTGIARMIGQLEYTAEDNEKAKDYPVDNLK